MKLDISPSLCSIASVMPNLQLPSWPSSTATALGCYWYSFPVSLTVGDWTGISGWLHTKMVSPRMVTHPSTKQARSRVILLIWPMLLPLSQTTTQIKLKAKDVKHAKIMSCNTSDLTAIGLPCMSAGRFLTVLSSTTRWVHVGEPTSAHDPPTQHKKTSSITRNHKKTKLDTNSKNTW